MRKRIWIVGIVGALMFVPAARAGEPTVHDLARRLAQLEQIVSRQNDSLAAQSNTIVELEAQLDAARSLSGPTAESSDSIRALIRDELSASQSPGVPAWLDGLKFHAKARLRYEWHGKKNRNISKSDDDRSRARYLLLFGFEKKINDQVTAGFELASEGPDPTSHNVTMGDAFAKDGIYINRLYMIYSPTDVPGLTVTGGKFKNNLDVVKSKMLWDSDISPEGFMVRYEPQMDNGVQPWIQGGYLLIDENLQSAPGAALSKDAGCFLLQAGGEAKLQDGVKLTGAVTYYDFHDLDHAPALVGLGNGTQAVDPIGGLSEDFRVWDAAAEIAFGVADMPCSVFAEYVKNTATSSGNDKDTALKTGVRVGKAKKKGQWAFQYDYSYTERDAFVAAFGDSDHSYNNYKAHTVGVKYKVFDNVELGATVYFLDDLNSAFATDGVSDSTILTQIDCVTNF